MNALLFLALMAAAPQDTSSTVLPTVAVTVAREPARSALELPYALMRFAPDSLRPGMRNATIDERLFLVPGVVIANRNNPTQDPRISVRGFGSRSAFGVRGVRVLMDGIPLTLPDGQTAIDYLDLESIGSLQLIRGSAASLYGNAAGGVLDIRSRAFPSTPFEPTAGYWLANAGQSRFVVSGAGTHGRSQYAVSFSRLNSDGYRDHSAQESSNGSVRFNTRLGSVGIAGSVLLYDMPLAENPGALTLTELQDNFRGAEQLSITRRARKEVSQVQAGLTLSAQSAGGAGDLELVIHGGARDLNNPLAFAIVNVERSVHGASLRGSHQMTFIDRPLRITAGVDYQAQDDGRTEYANCNGVVNPTTCPIAEEERGALRRDQTELVTSIGPFLRTEWELSPKVFLSAGVRSDRINFEVQDAFITSDNPDDSGERTLSAVSPMVGVVFRVAPLQSIYANYSEAFETPTATELGNKPDGSAGINPELNPQKSATTEIGTRGWLGAFTASGVSYDLAVYNSKVSDELIPFEIPGGAGRRYFRNAGSTLRTGVEASLATQIGMASLGLSYSYSHFRFEEYEVAGTDYSEKRIPGIPVQQLQGSATFRNGAWYLVMEGETRGGVYVSDANTIRSPGYELMNARLGWDGTGRLRWLSTRVGVQNVFDRRHVTSVSVNATNGRFYEPAPGRVYFAGVTLGVVR